MSYMSNANIGPHHVAAAKSGPSYVSPASYGAPNACPSYVSPMAAGGYPANVGPNVSPAAYSHHKPVVAGARYSNIGAILVLFILLVIITRKFCD